MKLNKKWLFIIYLILNSAIGKTQVSYFSTNALSKEKFEIFKKTTTLFTLQYADYAELEKFDNAIKKSWKITPYKIIRPEELAAYDTLTNYSFFYFNAYNEKIEETSKANIVYVLKLITPSKIPKQREENVFAFTTLFADVYTNLRVAAQDEKFNTKKRLRGKILNVLYNNSSFLNWSPGLLAGYLKQINDGLLSTEGRSLDFQFYNKVRLPELAKDTLYVPEYVRQVFSTQKTKTDSLQQPYTYKLKFLSTEKLDSLILKKDSNIKYLIYTQRSTDKIISIYDSKDNRIIYQMFTNQYADFEMNDLNTIKKIIKSIK
ncbi:hypothetical protein [Pedobacter mucosus]|uniref:hypothetical protein n=1 Tax=Pedobacter mucosus TaxID=2895286 RepID=UPI001EE4987D|nr:hypothetical protein [Pedobacter mucosus]UKT63091.1 hypothetical protein LOK61_15110 [Pedobacter mucosus]